MRDSRRQSGLEGIAKGATQRVEEELEGGREKERRSVGREVNGRQGLTPES